MPPSGPQPGLMLAADFLANCTLGCCPHSSSMEFCFFAASIPRLRERSACLWGLKAPGTPTWPGKGPGGPVAKRASSPSSSAWAVLPLLYPRRWLYFCPHCTPKKTREMKRGTESPGSNLNCGFLQQTRGRFQSFMGLGFPIYKMAIVTPHPARSWEEVRCPERPLPHAEQGVCCDLDSSAE